MLAVTPRERDVLRRALGWYSGYFNDLEHAVDDESCGLDLRWHAHVGLWLLDDLGWQYEDPRGEFFVTLPAPEFAHWLRRTLEATDSECEDERCELVGAGANARDEVAQYVAAGFREASSMAQTADHRHDAARRILDELLELRLVVSGLLERLEAAP